MQRVLFVLALLSVSAFADVQARPIRVHLKPMAPQEFVDAASKRLAASHADVLKELRKDKTLTFSDDPSHADLVLALVSSAQETFGVETTRRSAPFLPGSTATHTEQLTRPTVRMTLTAGTYEQPFDGGGASWTGAAASVSLQIRRWIKDNKAQLLAK